MTDEELRKLLAEAPEGPWTLRYYEEWEGQLAWEILAAGQAAGNGFMGDTPYYPWQPATSATVKLLAATPDLAAEVLRLREERAALEAENARLREALTIAKDAMREARLCIVAKRESNMLGAALDTARAALAGDA